MKRDVRRIALEFASHGVDGAVESDGMWDEIARVLSREETEKESAEVGLFLNAEAQRLRARATRLLNRRAPTRRRGAR